MFKFACFLLKFAPLWYLQFLVDALRSHEHADWKHLLGIRVNDVTEAIVLTITVITGILPSLIFFDNVYYNQFPELRI